MLNNLQVLRAVAAYAVVLYHAQPFIKRLHPLPYHSHLGAAGVDIFFVISGFIMVYASDRSHCGPAAFWRDRLIRILPLYWIITVAMIAVHSVGFSPSGLHNWDGSDLLTSLFLLPNIRLDGVSEPILSPAWTLIYEAFFYFFFGLFLLSGRISRATTILSVVFLSFWFMGVVFKPQPFAIKYYTNAILLEFGLGCLLGLLYLKSQALDLPHGATLSVLAIGLAIAVLIAQDWYLGVEVTRTGEIRLMRLGLPATVIVAGALILERSNHRASHRGALLLGSASYATYLIHPLILHAVYFLSAKVLPAGSIFSATVYLFAAFAAVCLFSVGLHLWVEAPLTRSLKQLSRSQSDRTGIPMPKGASAR
ncbi:acyltransferase [Mesorhizobium sp. M0768]|uniref:acyltransferase family protein n=1 Tax=unclassified Mesorhizobium TaxID=325217 RepID=UPI00333CAE6A